MKFKTNVVVGAVFLALLTFVYIYEIKGGEERKAEAEKSKRLLAAYAPSEVRRLVVDRGDTVLVLEKAQEEWKFVEPVEDLADQEAVDRYLRNIDEPERERVVADSAAVAEDAAVVAKYGLDQPRIKVQVETAEGVMDGLHFGNDSPTDRLAYVQIGGDNPEIFTVLAWRFDNLNKGVFDLRDRRILAFEEAEVKEIHLERAAGNIVLERAGDDAWQLRVGTSVAADKDAVDGLVGDLQNGKIESFADEEPDEALLQERGLGEKPQLGLSLLVGEDRAEKRLRVGHAEGGGYYARDLSRKAIFLIDSTLVHKLQLDISNLRDKEPLQFEPDDITRIELQRENETIIAEKDTAGQWELVEPAGRKARSWKLSGMLDDLKGLEVEEFVDDQVEDLAVYGLDQPRIKIRLLAAGEQVLEASLEEADGDQAFLTLVGTPSVYLVKSEVLEKVNLPLDAIADPPEPAEDESTDAE